MTAFITARKYIRHFVFVFFMASLSLAQSNELNPSLLLIADPDKTYSNNIRQSIINNLADTHIKIISSNHNTAIDSKTSDLIVTIGSSLARQVMETTESTTPVFSVLVPEAVIDEVTNKNNRPWAVQVIDQPIERQLLLIKHMFGKDTKIGIILGPVSSNKKNKIEQAAIDSGSSVSIKNIETTEQLIPTLKDTISQNDLILAIPDPVVYSKNTIRGILLLTYRSKTPVIGFSQSYIKAGATAGLYSTPEQIAQDAAQNIKNFFKNGKEFEQNVYHPHSFSVDINRRVAETLRLNINYREIINKINNKQQ